MNVEQMAADLLDADLACRAMEGCDLAFDCIGLPMERMSDHVCTARSIAAAMVETGTRCVHISSFWAYVPIERLPLREDHPRVGGPLPVRLRREAEDILRDAGAAVVNLPDFYGPEVHSSILQQALVEAAAGKTVHWVGTPETPREYVYVPDAMKAAAELSLHPEAYGDRWIVPGSGPITMNRVLEIAGEDLGRSVRVRSAGPLVLRILSAFVKPLRAFLPLVPTYLAPISYDGSKLGRLVAEIPATPYETAIPRTLDRLKGEIVRRS
jgi:nucleoside-diphosphate-sugar epimerase